MMVCVCVLFLVLDVFAVAAGPSKETVYKEALMNVLFRPEGRSQLLNL